MKRMIKKVEIDLIEQHFNIYINVYAKYVEDM